MTRRLEKLIWTKTRGADGTFDWECKTAEHNITIYRAIDGGRRTFGLVVLRKSDGKQINGRGWRIQWFRTMSNASAHASEVTAKAELAP
jgi:hypothetical protein